MQKLVFIDHAALKFLLNKQMLSHD